MEQTINRIKEQASHAQELYEEGMERGRELAKAASEKSAKAFDVTDDWVREDPWIALGIAAGVGLLLGMLIMSSVRNRDKAEKSQ